VNLYNRILSENPESYAFWVFCLSVIGAIALVLLGVELGKENPRNTFIGLALFIVFLSIVLSAFAAIRWQLLRKK